MARQDIERQKKLEPERIQYAIDALDKIGINVDYVDATKIKFQWKGSYVTFFPYSGWAAGKTIVDGRGLQNLLNQLKHTS